MKIEHGRLKDNAVTKYTGKMRIFTGSRGSIELFL